MTLPAGTRLGPYDILAPLGAGGMGEVYRARDTRLDRDVAIKILPPALGADAERLARFEREAKTLASLNHPHIAQIFGIEQAPSGQALVMELVDGEDLSERIARGALRTDQALPIAGQIADALEAAHERGIIHRDLKPANIKVSADGAVKVLDFGLAKAVDGHDGEADPRNSPTMSLAGTRAGMVLGTAAYMAPEQARGHVVDRRADIWAFGAVLFEMLSGQPAFGGETISDVLASVLKNDLDWSALPADVPAPVVSLLQRCLNPDRRNRLRDIGEARVAIADYLAHPTGKAQPGRVSRTPGRVQAAALAVAIVALAGALAMLAFRGRAVDVPPMRFVVSPPQGVLALVTLRPSVAMSPDGWTLAFVGLDEGVSALYLRGPQDFDPRKLPGTEGASNPVFSPDGRRIAFAAGNDLKVAALGGAVTALARVNDPRGIAWVDDAMLVFTPEAIGGVHEMSVNGGVPRALSTLDEEAGERTHRWPHVLPGGDWVLFTVGTISTPDTYDDARIDAVNRRTGERRVVFQGASMVRYAPTGHLVFAKGGSLFAVAFDPATLKVAGAPVSVLQGIAGDVTTGAAHMDWSASGTFAYVPGDGRGGLRQFVWSDFRGARTPIGLPSALYNDARLSPDGKRAALVDGTSGAADIWVYTFDGERYTRVTFTTVNATPIWSADGRDLYYSAIDPAGSGTTVFRTSADGGREPVEIVKVDARVYLKNLSPDGSWAVVDYVDRGRANIGSLDLEAGGTIAPIVATPADEFGGALSPDGRFVAYQSDGDGLPQVYVRQVEAPTGRWQVSNAGGEEPMWAPRGDAIYYRFEHRMMRVPVDTTSTFQPGQPVLLFENVFNLRSDTNVSYQPHPDGARLLMTRPADAASAGSVRVITRWFDQLKAIR